MEKIRLIIRSWLYRRAIRRADRLSAAFRTTFYVLADRGRFRVASRTAVKGLIRQGRFRRGVSIRDFDRIALYTSKNF